MTCASMTASRRKTLHLCGVEPGTFRNFDQEKHVRIKREAKHPEKEKWDTAVTVTAPLWFGLPCHYTSMMGPFACSGYLPESMYMPP